MNEWKGPQWNPNIHMHERLRWHNLSKVVPLTVLVAGYVFVYKEKSSLNTDLLNCIGCQVTNRLNLKYWSSLISLSTIRRRGIGLLICLNEPIYCPMICCYYLKCCRSFKTTSPEQTIMCTHVRAQYVRMSISYVLGWNSHFSPKNELLSPIRTNGYDSQNLTSIDHPPSENL